MGCGHSRTGICLDVILFFLRKGDSEARAQQGSLCRVTTTPPLNRDSLKLLELLPFPAVYKYSGGGDWQCCRGEEEGQKELCSHQQGVGTWPFAIKAIVHGRTWAQMRPSHHPDPSRTASHTADSRGCRSSADRAVPANNYPSTKVQHTSALSEISMTSS